VKNAPVAMNAGKRLDESPEDRAPHEPIERPSPLTPDAADDVGGDEPVVAPPHASFSGQPLFSENHQMGKIDFVLVGRRVGTVIKTELAVIALIDDPAMVLRAELGHIPFILVDAIEQGIERGAEIEAAAAAVADFVDAQRLFVQLRSINRSDKGKTSHVVSCHETRRVG
jgi:hypothetical protein